MFGECRRRAGGVMLIVGGQDIQFHSFSADGVDTRKEGAAIFASNSFLHKARSKVSGCPVPPSAFKLR